MKYLAHLCVVVIGVFFLASPAAAQVGKDSGIWEFVEADGLDKALVVVQGDQNGGTGTGCVVAGPERAEILTAAHVVEGNQSFTVSFHDGSAKRGTLRRMDRDADLATLNCDTPEGCSVLEVAAEVSEGETVRVLGFGGGQGLRVFRSEVAAIGDASLIMLTYAVPGDSGGPVVNAAGKVVGVVSGGTLWCKRKIKTAAKTVHSMTAPVRAGTCARINRLLRR